MANIKGRVKARKSAPPERRGRSKKPNAPTGTRKTPRKAPSQTDSVSEPNNLSITSELERMSPEEKVQYFLENKHLLNEKYFIKQNKEDFQYRLNRLGNESFLEKETGHIKKKKKFKMKYVDEILKSELLIDVAPKNKPARSKKTDTNGINNNNNTALRNQNGGKNSSKSKETNSKEVVKKITRGRKPGKEEKTPKKDKTKEKKSSKAKQVTLSNGVVLTLSLLQCDYCKKTFSNKSSLRRHIYVHLDLKPHTCPHCQRKFRQRFNLKVHIKRQHPDVLKKAQQYICHICDKPFLLQENLSLHLAGHIKNENSFKCVYCNKKFSYQLLLLQHEKQHLVQGKYQCTICNMSYDCRTRLSLHVKSHLKVKDYICQYCGKEFLRLNSMRRHVQICHVGHTIQCPICKKQLKGHLTEHMRTHDKKRPHECPDCGQKFTQSTQLNVHRRAHTGARPYPCRICKRPFTHSNALMLHIRRHTGEKPFPCAMCPMSFSQLPHMKAHMRNIHGKENPYKCIKCNQFFKLKNILEAHTQTCTVGDRELSFEEKIEASVQCEEIVVESVMSLSRMRFLLALLLTMIATKEKLKYLGFNKRLIDDLLVESLEAMGHTPYKDPSLSPLKRLKSNIEILLNGTVPKYQMEKFKRENKTIEELLELLTDEKKKE